MRLHPVLHHRAAVLTGVAAALAVILDGSLLLADTPASPHRRWRSGPPGRVAPPDGAAPAPAKGASEEPAKKSPTPPAAEDTVVVKSFKFTGNTSIPEAELAAVVAPYVGQSSDLKRLQEAAEKVTEAYRRRGLTLARAYLPAQAVQEGVVEIAVLEGKLGEITVEGNRNYSADFIRRFLLKAQRGETLTTENLERGLLVLNEEFSDLRVTSTLERGKQPGTVDVRARVEDSFPLHLTLNANNFGSDSVGRYRFGGQIDWTNIAATGAHLSLGGVIGERPDQLAYGIVKLDFPVDSRGTKVGVSGNFGDFDVTQEFSDLGLGGESAGGGFYVSHPCVKTRTLGLTAEAGFQSKDTRFFAFETILSNDRIRYAYAAANLYGVHGGGKSYASLNVSQGLGRFLGGLREDDPDASRFEADNSFTRFTLHYLRIQPLSRVFTLTARAAGQWSSDSLVSSEEWQIGGPDTVRGFAPGEASGEDGYTAGLELLAAPFEKRDICQFVAFVDNGGANRQSRVVGQKKFTSLTGAGLGVRSHLPFGADLRIDVAWPLDPPEGSLDESPVLYGSATLRF